MNNWFLSFDCATKTLGYTLTYLDLEYSRNNKKAMENDESLIPNAIQLHEIKVINLLPDKKNNSISAVERIMAMCNYFDGALTTMLKKYKLYGQPITVILEDQMPKNIEANIICIALATLFHWANVQIIKPWFKNMICVAVEAEYNIKYFKEKYKSSQYANKAHAKCNFLRFVEVFDIKHNIKASLLEHVADSFMQMLAFVYLDTTAVHRKTTYRRIPRAGNNSTARNRRRN